LCYFNGYAWCPSQPCCCHKISRQMRDL
jgi:hypothetical protein